MKPAYILALDQGTTSSRTLVVNHAGEIVATSQMEIAQSYPRPGWVEHDPIEIWESQYATVEEALTTAELSFSDIASIGITNQRETTIVWDRKTGEPIYPAIVWQDRRTANACLQMKQDGLEAEFTAKTGLRLDPYFAGTKVSWILDHVAGAHERAKNGELCFGTVDSWLIWKLTGGKIHITDASNASRTLFYNIHRGNWDDDLLELLQIPKAMLPEVVDSSGIVAETTDGMAIGGIAGDQHAALFGQACFDLGMAKNTYGTGCFLLMNTGKDPVQSNNSLLTTIAWQIDGKVEYALEGSIFMGGAIVQWLRDEMQLVTSAGECSRLAGTLSDAGGLFLVPAFAGLGAPHWDPYARGLAIGMTRGTNRNHFCRAAIEAIGFQSAELAECMERDSQITIKELRVDGGASRSDPLLEFQADLLQTKVVRPRNTETTALGAAYLAGLAVNFWSDKAEIATLWKQGMVFEPSRKSSEMVSVMESWRRAVERSKAWEISNNT